MAAINNVLTSNGFQQVQLSIKKKKGKCINVYHLKDDYPININKFKQAMQIFLNKEDKKITFSVEKLSEAALKDRPYFIQYGNILSFGKEKPFKSGAHVNTTDRYFSGTPLEDPVKCIHNKTFEKDRFIEWAKDQSNFCPCGKTRVGDGDWRKWVGLTDEKTQSIKRRQRFFEDSGPNIDEAKESFEAALADLKTSQNELGSAIDRFDEIFFSRVNLEHIISIEHERKLNKYVAVGSSMALAAGGVFLLVTVPGGVVGGILLSGGLNSGSRLCAPIYQGKNIDLKGHFAQIGIGFACSAVSLPIDIRGAQFIKDAAWSGGTKLAASYGLWAASGVVSSLTSKTLQNLFEKKKWNEGLGVAAFSGMVSGVASGAFSYHFKTEGLGDTAKYKDFFDNKKALKRVALTSLVGGVSGAASAGLATVAVNWCAGEQWNKDLSKNAFEAGLMGLIRGAINGSIHVHHERKRALAIKESLIKYLENADETMPGLGKNIKCAKNGQEQKNALIKMIRNDAIAVFGETTLKELIDNPHDLFKGLLDEKLIYDKTGHRVAEVASVFMIGGGLTLIIFAGPAGGVVGGALLSAGIAGLQDAVTKDINNHPLDLKDYLTKIGISGAVGAVTGGISCAAAPWISQAAQGGVRVVTVQIAKQAVVGAVAGAAGKGVGNLLEDNDLTEGMGQAAFSGGIGGAVGGGIGIGVDKIAKRLAPAKKVMVSAIGGGIGSGAVDVVIKGIQTGEFDAQGFTIAVVTGAIIGGGTTYRREAIKRQKAINKEFAKPGNRKKAIIELAKKDDCKLEFIDAKTGKKEVWNSKGKKLVRIELNKSNQKGGIGHAKAVLENGQRVDSKQNDTYCMERAYLIGKDGARTLSTQELQLARTRSQDLLAPKLGKIFSQEYDLFKEEALFGGKRSKIHKIPEKNVQCPLRREALDHINEVLKLNREGMLFKNNNERLTERDILYLKDGKEALCMRGGTKFQSKAFVDLGVNPLRKVFEKYGNAMNEFTKKRIVHTIDQAPRRSGPIYPVQEYVNAQFSSAFGYRRVTDIAREIQNGREMPHVKVYPQPGGHFTKYNHRAGCSFELAGKQPSNVGFAPMAENQQHFLHIENYDKNILPTRSEHIADHKGLKFIPGIKGIPKKIKTNLKVMYKPVDKRNPDKK